MKLNTKKTIATLGVIVIAGLSASTAKGYTSCNFNTSNNELTAYASGNINSSAFSYGGFHSKPRTDYTDRVCARMSVFRAFYSGGYEYGKALTTSSFSKTKKTGSKEKKGIVIELRTYGTNGESVTSFNSRIIRCN